MDLFSEIVKNHVDGATINLFVKSGAENNIFPVSLNEWRKRIEIKVIAEAKENKANLEVIKLIAGFYNKPVRNVTIIKGSINIPGYNLIILINFLSIIFLLIITKSLKKKQFKIIT